MATTIALITGANKGIGLETARQLGARGITVLAGARDEARGMAAERALRDEGADARFVSLDMTDAKSVQQAADWIDREYGRLDILVNNAAIARGGPPSGTDLAEMREVYETNVFGVIMVTNAMLPLLRRAAAARIVNVSSEVGSITSMTDPASPLAQMPAGLAYPSSKSALNMITAMYAKELRGQRGRWAGRAESGLGGGAAGLKRGTEQAAVSGQAAHPEGAGWRPDGEDRGRGTWCGCCCCGIWGGGAGGLRTMAGRSAG